MLLRSITIAALLVFSAPVDARDRQETNVITFESTSTLTNGLHKIVDGREQKVIYIYVRSDQPPQLVVVDRGLSKEHIELIKSSVK